jgi:hypothetical protein
MENLVIIKQGEEHFYVALVNNKGQVILRGNECSSLAACKYSVDSIRANATDYSKYELMTSCEGKYYFKLKGSDGKEIAQSDIFNTAADRYSGIGLVRRMIPYAVVDDHAFAI